MVKQFWRWLMRLIQPLLPPGDFHFQKIYQNKSKIFADQNRFFASFNSLYSKIFLSPTLCLFYGCKKAESLADS